jgi:hypothetical protein
MAFSTLNELAHDPIVLGVIFSLIVAGFVKGAIGVGTPVVALPLTKVRKNAFRVRLRGALAVRASSRLQLHDPRIAGFSSAAIACGRGASIAAGMAILLMLLHVIRRLFE